MATEWTGRQLVAQIEGLWDVPMDEDTVDKFVAGDPDTPVRGIASTFIPSVPFLQEAIRRGLNFILTHEPTFYNHHDRLEEVPAEAEHVVQVKLDLIREHGLMIYRLHDRPHQVRPDMIHEGFLRRCGWQAGPRGEHGLSTARIDPMPLGKLAACIRDRVGGQAVRFIGDPEQMCSTLWLGLGSPGFGVQYRAANCPEIDALILGETSEWAVGLFMEDIAALVRPVPMVLLGHRNAEESGMAWIAEVISQRLGIEIQHIVVPDPMRPAPI